MVCTDVEIVLRGGVGGASFKVVELLAGRGGGEDCVG